MFHLIQSITMTVSQRQTTCVGVHAPVRSCLSRRVCKLSKKSQILSSFIDLRATIGKPGRKTMPEPLYRVVFHPKVYFTKPWTTLRQSNTSRVNLFYQATSGRSSIQWLPLFAWMPPHCGTAYKFSKLFSKLFRQTNYSTLKLILCHRSIPIKRWLNYTIPLLPSLNSDKSCSHVQYQEHTSLVYPWASQKSITWPWPFIWGVYKYHPKSHLRYLQEPKWNLFPTCLCYTVLSFPYISFCKSISVWFS